MLLNYLFTSIGLCASSVLTAPSPTGWSTSFDPTSRASSFDWNTPNKSSNFIDKRDNVHSEEWFNSHRKVGRWNDASVVSKRTSWQGLTGPNSLYSYPTGVSWGGSRVDAFYHDQDGNVCSHLYFNDGVNWQPEENLGGAWSSSFGASTWGPGSIFVYGHGSDGACWYNSYSSNGWSGWSTLGGLMTYEPSTVTWGVGRSDVFVIAASDGECWHRVYNGGSWGAWESLGGAITYAPHSSSWGVGHISIFVIATADGQCWHRMWLTSMGGWSQWEALGGTIVGPISSVSWLGNRIDIFARGTDNNLWHRRYHGDTNVWEIWEVLGITQVAFAPNVVQYGTFLVVFVVRLDGSLWSATYNQGLNSWSSWTSSGGSIASQPSGVVWNNNITGAFGEGSDKSCQFF
ncbi:hypothetical protein GQ53DRAFT_774522 [Thozetella sp. PMI_491]|nr:hypothetical protein GQ53DRAFT_774522 [Thozetella sp. PMI_491]